tara:strand:+ start:296 stop:502 length:207 start_codon:yes stop_codon:yes gene_type:complete
MSDDELWTDFLAFVQQYMLNAGEILTKVVNDRYASDGLKAEAEGFLQETIETLPTFVARIDAMTKGDD